MLVFIYIYKHIWLLTIYVCIYYLYVYVLYVLSAYIFIYRDCMLDFIERVTPFSVVSWYYVTACTYYLPVVGRCYDASVGFIGYKINLKWIDLICLSIPVDYIVFTSVSVILIHDASFMLPCNSRVPVNTMNKSYDDMFNDACVSIRRPCISWKDL